MNKGDTAMKTQEGKEIKTRKKYDAEGLCVECGTERGGYTHVGMCATQGKESKQGATPELLEAARDMLESLTDFYKAEPKLAGEYFGAALMGRVEAAIAKAQGGA